MVDQETTAAPSIDELAAKSDRLANEVLDANTALDTAKATFADAAKSDPAAVEALLELATGVKTAEATVSAAQRAVSKNQTDIDGIRYDEAMAGVSTVVGGARDEARPIGETFFAEKAVTKNSIDTLTLVLKREESGKITVSGKPDGEKMPKRPSSGRGGGGGGPRGKRSVEVNGVSMSCRDYVESCGTDASPAAQADLSGTWTGSPVSYTNEAKRLAAKRGDTFS